MTTLVYSMRHGEYDGNDPEKSLTPKGYKKSKDLWELLRDTQERAGNILVVTSTAKRAVQTGEWIAEWLWLGEEGIITTKTLREEWTYFADIEKAALFIKSLEGIADAALLIIVSHTRACELIAKALWAKNVPQIHDNLWCVKFSVDFSEEDEDTKRSDGD